jgi:hypothetical protein
MQRAGSQRTKAKLAASLTLFVICVMDQAMSEWSFAEDIRCTGTKTLSVHTLTGRGS